MFYTQLTIMDISGWVFITESQQLISSAKKYISQIDFFFFSIKTKQQHQQWVYDILLIKSEKKPLLHQEQGSSPCTAKIPLVLCLAANTVSIHSFSVNSCNNKPRYGWWQKNLLYNSSESKSHYHLLFLIVKQDEWLCSAESHSRAKPGNKNALISSLKYQRCTKHIVHEPFIVCGNHRQEH